MKKIDLNFVLALCLASMFSSCATVFGGPQTAYQKTPPKPGEPQREIRVGALIADIILLARCRNRFCYWCYIQTSSC